MNAGVCHTCHGIVPVAVCPLCSAELVLDAEQAAADDDLARGADEVTHARAARARKQAGRDREATAQARDSEGVARSRSASERDRVAAGRDDGAADRDALSRLHDLSDAAGSRLDPILLRAARDRAQAAMDRERAADDRAQAAADREIAARERAEALEIRAESAGLAERAATDQLTGARTRTFGLEEAERELGRARRTRAPLTLAFVDVDGLKRLNDTRGHLAGDAALRSVGRALRANLRPYDVVVRFGGDEFVCLMQSISVEEAEERFARISHELAAIDPEHTIGFGLAQARDGENLDDLIARADADLLESRNGIHH